MFDTMSSLYRNRMGKPSTYVMQVNAPSSENCGWGENPKDTTPSNCVSSHCCATLPFVISPFSTTKRTKNPKPTKQITWKDDTNLDGSALAVYTYDTQQREGVESECWNTGAGKTSYFGFMLRTPTSQTLDHILPTDSGTLKTKLKVMKKKVCVCLGTMISKTCCYSRRL